MKKIILIFILLFLSNQFQLDAELRLVGISEPGNFKADTGRFSDAYYVMTEAPVEVKALVYNDSNIDISNAKARVRIYKEKSDGSFDNQIFLERTIYFNISKKDSLDIEFYLASNGDFEKFFPTTYKNILEIDSNFLYPEYFSNMISNVTPRYQIKVDLFNQSGSIIDSQSRVVRFYLKIGNKILLSAENSLVELDENSTADQIAGKLNSDSLKRYFSSIFYDEHDPFRDFSVFDRKNWDENSIDYTPFNYLFWADGDDKPISQTERKNIIEFLKSGVSNSKKNLMICSQELARIHGKDGIEPDSIFLTGYLRSLNYSPGNPKGKGISCDSIQIKGVALYRNGIFKVNSTKYINDSPPYCGVVSLDKYGEGLVRETAKYFPDSNFVTNELYAGMSNVTLTKSIAYLAIDWRHFQNPEYVIRAAFDYFDQNTGSYEKVYFIQKSRLDSNVNNYPGETIEFEFRYGYYYSDMGTPSHYGYFDNNAIHVWNPLIERMDTIWTNKDGYAYYKFQIPINTLPGIYKLKLYALHENTEVLFEVKEPIIEIVGDNNSCELQSKIYYIYKSDYHNLIWQIQNGAILSYNSDSTEITVQWGESGEGKINLEMFKDSETKQLELNVTINPKPEKPMITQIENTLKSTSSFRYQWYYNNELIEGAIDSIYEPQQSGYYSVIITNISGCASEVSEQIYFEKTINVEEKKLNNPYFEISPNPATDYIEINVGVRHAVPIENREIQIYNIYGEKINVVVQNFEPLRINISNFPTGIYFIRINNEIQKFVIMR